MSSARKDELRFVKQVLAGGAAMRDGERFVVGAASLPARRVRELAAAGVLALVGETVAATAATAGWLRRSLLEGDRFADQHREIAAGPEGTRLNLGDDVLARLGRPDGKARTAFLSPAQLEAGLRLRRMWQRAGIAPRLTMHYSPDHMPGSGSGQAEVGDMAADARRRFNALLAELPPDCARVVFDIAAELRGLQEIETDAGWPRRSAKLVLRIGLEQVARSLGLSDRAEGPQRGRVRAEMQGERVAM
jgi:hypothetical protein